jgi:hypothetical protein
MQIRNEADITPAFYNHYYAIPISTEGAYTIQADDGSAEGIIVAECRDLADAAGIAHLCNEANRLRSVLDRVVRCFEHEGQITDQFGDDKSLCMLLRNLWNHPTNPSN